SAAQRADTAAGCASGYAIAESVAAVGVTGRGQPMRFSLAGGIIAAFMLFALVVGYSSVFTVYQTNQAIVVRLGQPIRVVTDPGLNFKFPLLDNVISVEKRIVDLENAAQEVITSDQKRLVVDAFARYRINDALKFYQTIGVIEGANARLSTILNSALRRVLGE